MDVISLVNFDNRKRVAYLDRSFGSYYRFNSRTRHVVFDSTKELYPELKERYAHFGVELVHMPGAPFGARLHAAAQALRSDYFLFLPDDFEWIFAYPLAQAIEQCRRHNIHELKLTCRGQDWFSQNDATPQAWFNGARVISGEVLDHQDDLFISRRRWFKNAHEQFSLACNVIQSEFAAQLFPRLPREAVSPGKAEISGYLRLLFKRYWVAYYKMWIPAFHFVDLQIEPDTELNRLKARQNLTTENARIYNSRFNV